MGRAERRRAEREQRQRGTGAARIGAWTAPTGQLRSTQTFDHTPDEVARQHQDFLAGTVFAAGAGAFFPTGGDSAPPDVTSLFLVTVHEDERTFAPAPVLRDAFELVDQHGGVQLHTMLTVSSGWGMLGGDAPLAKLRLGFTGLLTGSADIVLVAQNYAEQWQHIAHGGLLGITTPERTTKALSRSNATFYDAMNSTLVIGMATSPALMELTSIYNWPG